MTANRQGSFHHHPFTTSKGGQNTFTIAVTYNTAYQEKILLIKKNNAK